MLVEAWLPVNYDLHGEEKLKLVECEGVDWQIYVTKSGGRALIAKEPLAQRWLDTGILNAAQLKHASFGQESFFSLACEEKYKLSPVNTCEAPFSESEALTFATALKATRKQDRHSTLCESIYVEKIGRLLPVYVTSEKTSDDMVLGTWLTGGVPVSAHSIERMQKLVRWLNKDSMEQILTAAGLYQLERKSAPGNAANSNSLFSLAGRPQLESFFNEHVVDIVNNRDRYKALGIESPSAIILHGPPGCGKTFAVAQLIEFLGWPSFEIDASSIASPYVHETSRKIASIFDRAIDNAPSVVVIDEMEAFLTDRQAGNGHHHVEEVAEFLRRIPEAIKNNVLIIAMTNRIEMIDPAILRRGRFDHILKVDMASEVEVLALLKNLISKIPQEGDIDLDVLAKKLVGRPLSDVTFIVREGARLAARASKDKIGQKYLLQALETAPAREMYDL